MKTVQQKENGEEPANRLKVYAREYMLGALRLLQCAYDYAKELRQDPWCFSVAAPDLKRQGLREIELRWLVGKGFVLWGTKRPLTSLPPPKQQLLCSTTRVIMTATGERFAATVLRTTTKVADPPSTDGSDRRLPVITPAWDPLRRTLMLGSTVVKQLRRPAKAQELIFTVFEESGWPDCIDDPLPPDPTQNSKRRLHHTINNLNRHQRNALIRFYSNGNGSGIRWAWQTHDVPP